MSRSTWSTPCACRRRPPTARSTPRLSGPRSIDVAEIDQPPRAAASRRQHPTLRRAGRVSSSAQPCTSPMANTVSPSRSNGAAFQSGIRQEVCDDGNGHRPCRDASPNPAARASSRVGGLGASLEFFLHRAIEIESDLPSASRRWHPDMRGHERVVAVVDRTRRRCRPPGVTRLSCCDQVASGGSMAASRYRPLSRPRMKLSSTRARCRCATGHAARSRPTACRWG